MDEQTQSHQEGRATEPTPAAPKETVREIHHHHYPEKGRFHFGRIVIGLIIIFIGVVYLAQANGWAGVDVNLDWGKLWPLIIIFVGLSMLGGRGWMSGTIGIIVTIAILAIAALLIFTPADRTTTTDTITVAKDAAATSAVVNVKAGAGTLDVTGGATDLVNGTRATNVANKTYTDTSTADGIQTVTVREENANWTVVGRHTNTLDLRLNESLPTKLNLDTGAMSMDLDLTSINAEEVNVNTGASSMNLTLGDIATLAKVSIDAGASSFDLSLPSTVGAKIHVDAGLSSKDFPNFNKIDDSNYETTGYASAEKKIDIDLDMGVSSINIAWR